MSISLHDSVQRAVYTITGRVRVWRNEHRNISVADKGGITLREFAPPLHLYYPVAQ